MVMYHHREPGTTSKGALCEIDAALAPALRQSSQVGHAATPQKDAL